MPSSPLKTLILILLPLLASAAPGAAAQTSEGAPVDQLDEIEARLASLESRLSILDILVQWASNETSASRSLAGAVADLNVSLASHAELEVARYSNLTIHLAQLHSRAANATLAVDGLTSLLLDLASRSNTTQASLGITAQQLREAALNLSSTRGALQLGLDRIATTVDEMDANHTRDHVKLYGGVYITDPLDPNKGAPAYVKLFENDHTLAHNQQASLNQTRADIAHVGQGVDAGRVEAKARAEEAAATDRETNQHILSRLKLNAWLAAAQVLLLVIPSAYLFGPTLLHSIQARRNRTTAGLPPSPEEGVEPTPEEMSAFRQAAKHARPRDPPQPEEVAPATRPRRRFTSPGGPA